MNIELLKEELLRDEGLELKPYTDTVGKTTIGVGRNLSDVGITRAEAMHLLENDIGKASAELDRVKPSWRDMSDDQQRALVNLTFNMGMPRLQHFKKMWAALESGRFATAADELLNSRYASQVGDRAKRMAELLELD